MVLGVGAGVVVLVVVWVAAVVAAAVACGRRRSLVAAGVIVAAALLSLTLLLLPQHLSPHQPPVEDVVIDNLFIGRIVIVVLVGVSAVAGVGVVLAQWTDPVLAAPLRKVKL